MTVIASLAEEQLEVSARHAKSSPLAMFITLGIIANLMYPYSADYEWVIWLAAVITALVLRFVTFNVIFERVQLAVETKVNIALVLSVFHGIAQASSLWFFTEYSEIERALISLILAGFCLQATATGGDIRQFLSFSLPIMPTIALLWTTGGTFTLQTLEATLLGISIALFYVQQIYIARSNDEKARSSHESRTQLAKLNEELQVAVQRADVANRAKTKFLASASHDLRQPIHALSLFSAALVRQSLPNQASEIADHIDQSVRVLSNQLDALLDLSKLDAGIVEPKLETLAVDRFLTRISREYASEAKDKGLKLVTAISVYGSVSTDSLLLERVVRNLLNNAVRYTDNGFIKVASNATTVSGEQHLQIIIQDSGQGISDEEQTRIFDEFYQVGGHSTASGLGLGLSIVKRLTELLGVQISISSTPGDGTSFTLTMPLISDTSHVETSELTDQTINLAEKTVLVVDDEPDIRIAMQNLLSAVAVNVVVAEDAAQAIQAAQAQPIDALITDLGLGESDGLSVASELRAKNPELPIILITGDTNSHKLQAAHESDFILMHKPVNSDELLARLNNAL